MEARRQLLKKNCARLLFIIPLWSAVICLACSSATDASNRPISDGAPGSVDTMALPDTSPPDDAPTNTADTTTIGQDIGTSVDLGATSYQDATEDLTQATAATGAWIEISGDNAAIAAYYGHPDPGVVSPAVVYNHGKIVELQGYEGAASMGYDITDFVHALNEAGFAALAPVRNAGGQWNDGTLEAALNFLKGEEDILPDEIIMLGFSRGATLSLEYTVYANEPLKSLVLIAPAPGKNNRFVETLESLEGLDTPLFVLRGEDEPNSTIVENVDALITKLSELGKYVRHKTDYPGDHKWFFEVRPEYWEDIVDFLQEDITQAP